MAMSMGGPALDFELSEVNLRPGTQVGLKRTGGSPPRSPATQGGMGGVSEAWRPNANWRADAKAEELAAKKAARRSPMKIAKPELPKALQDKYADDIVADAYIGYGD